MTTLTQLWYAEDSSSKQVAQYGIRLPDGEIHWGNVTMPGQPTVVPHGGLTFTVFADPAPQVDPQRTIEGVRSRIANSLREARVSEDAMVAHVDSVVRVKRTIVVHLGDTEEV